MGVAEVGGFAAVVVAPPVPEPGFSDPQAGAKLVQDDAGLFGEFAASCLGGGLAVLGDQGAVEVVLERGEER
jgi:hypothetical protein